MSIIQEYHKCKKPDCFRKVSKGSLYCCYACSIADEGRYEVHESGQLAHSDDCNQRKSERGEYSIYDMS